MPYMFFNPFKMAVHFLKTASNFSNFDDPNRSTFFPNSTGPWPQLQKGRKTPENQFDTSRNIAATIKTFSSLKRLICIQNNLTEMVTR